MGLTIVERMLGPAPEPPPSSPRQPNADPINVKLN